jgi:hypothetical protein
MYKILGGDGKEYGPVSSDTLRQWVREGRANAQTQVKVEGAADWQALGSIPELDAMFRAAPPAMSAAPAGPGVVYEGNYELDIFGCVSRSFDLFKVNMGPMIVATLIAFSPQIVGTIVRMFSIIPIIGILFSLVGMVISLATIAIGGPLLGGLFSVILKLTRGQPVEQRDSFIGFRKHFLHLFLGQLVPGLFIGVCMLPTIVVLIVTVVVKIANNPHSDPEFTLFIPTLIAFAVSIPVLVWLSTNWKFTLALVVDRDLDFWTAMKISWRRVMRHWWTVFGLMVVLGLINLVGVLACFVGLIFTLPITLGALMQAYETIFTPRAAQPGTGA